MRGSGKRMKGSAGGEGGAGFTTLCCCTGSQSASSQQTEFRSRRVVPGFWQPTLKLQVHCWHNPLQGRLKQEQAPGRERAPRTRTRKRSKQHRAGPSGGA